MIRISPLKLLDFTPREASGKPIGGDQRCPECIHLSAIIQPMRVAAGKKSGDIPGEQPWIRAQGGFWLEVALDYAQRVYQEAERPHVVRQIHLHLDGIGVTPDGWDPHDRVLESDKSTQQSMRKWDEDTVSCNEDAPPEHFWDWMVHDMGALKAFNAFQLQGNPRWVPVYTMRHITHWLLGDYSRKPGRGTQLTICDVTFSPAKIEENWTLILRYKDYLLKKEQEASNVSEVQALPGEQAAVGPAEGLEAAVQELSGDAHEPR